MPELAEITAFMISQLTGFLQLRDRSNDRAQSVFLTHPTTMFAAVSSCMLYYLLHIAMLLFPTSRFSVAAQSFLVLSAYAAVSTLAAATLPDWVSPPIYTVFGLLSAGELLNMFRDRVVVIEGEEEEGEASTSENIYTRRFRRFFKKTCSVWSNSFSSSLSRYLWQQSPLICEMVHVRTLKKSRNEVEPGRVSIIDH